MKKVSENYDEMVILAVLVTSLVLRGYGCFASFLTGQQQELQNHNSNTAATTSSSTENTRNTQATIKKKPLIK